MSGRQIGFSALIVALAAGGCGGPTNPNPPLPIAASDAGAPASGAGTRGGGAPVTGASAGSDAGMDSGPTLGALGDSCTAGTDCATGYCVDSVCCDTQCQGTCYTCAAASSLGTCTAVAAGSDPRNDCPTEAMSTCGKDGTCNGAGACTQQPTSLQCVAPSCSGST